MTRLYSIVVLTHIQAGRTDEHRSGCSTCFSDICLGLIEFDGCRWIFLFFLPNGETLSNEIMRCQHKPMSKRMQWAAPSAPPHCVVRDIGLCWHLKISLLNSLPFNNKNNKIQGTTINFNKAYKTCKILPFWTNMFVCCDSVCLFA